jgi:hypothetical protein
MDARLWSGRLRFESLADGHPTLLGRVTVL